MGRRRQRRRWPKPPLRWLFSAAILLLCLCQGWSALLRNVLVLAQSDYLSYINHIPEYRARDFDMSKLRGPLDHNPKFKVGINMRDPWLAKTVRLDLAWDVQLVEPLGATDVTNGKTTPMPTPAGPIEYWFFDTPTLPASITDSDIVARNSDITLARNCCFLIDVSNANGVEQPAHRPTRLLDRRPADHAAGCRPRRWICHPHDSLDFPGRACERARSHYLDLTSDVEQTPDTKSITAQTMQLRFAVTAGINALHIACGETPDLSHQPSGDTRPLMWQMSDPSVSFTANPATLSGYAH